PFPFPFPFPETRLSVAKTLLIAIFNDRNQTSLFFMLTNCIKSIRRNNFLRFSINHGYKFCIMLVLRHGVE
ncbi:hypothetical protein FHP00_28150, partial [Escherichia coli]|nr:hypothetical protein [Escherichia coli]